MIEEFNTEIKNFEEIAEKINKGLASEILFDRSLSSKMLETFETNIVSLQDSTNKIREFMLTLKPEKAETIERSVSSVLQPLSNFKSNLFDENTVSLDAKRGVDELRHAIIEGFNLVELARNIENNPSTGIAAILSLKEVYDAKEYLSTISVPNTIYAQLTDLKKVLMNLKRSIQNLAPSIVEIRDNLDLVLEEIAKYKPTLEESISEVTAAQNREPKTPKSFSTSEKKK